MLLTLCIAVLIAQVDTSVVNLALRPIGQYFRVGVAPLQWVVDSYNVTYAVLLLTGGLLADLYGRRLVFIAGAALFTAASLVCAVAPGIPVLVAGRAAAGVGAALLLPSSLAIIRVAWPEPGQRGKALGIWAGCNGLAFIIGPLLGGMLITILSWRSIFFITVPLGLAALLLAVRTVRETRDPQGRHFDAAAQVAGAVALGGLTVAAIALHAPAVAIPSFLAALLALGLFLKVEAGRGATALVPLDMFRSRTFGGTITAIAGMTFGMYGLIFLLPLSWQSSGRLDSFGSGLALLPMAVVFVLVSPFSESLGAKLGATAMTAGGVSIIGIGLAVIGLSAPSLPPVEVGLALTGLGMGFATGPLMGAAVGSVEAARSGTAAALVNVARMAGATMGVAVLGAAYSLLDGGPAGLRLSLLIGSCVQLLSAGIAWRATSRRARLQIYKHR